MLYQEEAKFNVKSHAVKITIGSILYIIINMPGEDYQNLRTRVNIFLTMMVGIFFLIQSARKPPLRTRVATRMYGNEEYTPDRTTDCCICTCMIREGWVERY